MSSSTNYSGVFTKEKLIKGDGFIIEGVLIKHNIHTIFLNGKQPAHETPLPTRFVSIVLEFDNGIKRNWKDGVELPPKMTRGTAITKGYLNKFDRVEAKIIDKVNCDQIVAAIGQNGKALPDNFHDEALQSLHPNKKNYLELWADVEKFAHKIFKSGDEIRIKTMGDSVFIESIVKMDQNNMANLAGDSQLGDSFSKNIMKRYDEINTNDKPDEEEDDDEWK